MESFAGLILRPLRAREGRGATALLVEDIIWPRIAIKGLAPF
jgi:hypothetical protein